MALQSILRIGVLVSGLAVTGLAVTGVASAQSNPPPGLRAHPQAAVRDAPAAPVARRQPRPSDIPATPSATGQGTDPVVLEDEALNRKISGICRGC